jgi:hypothetical protein
MNILKLLLSIALISPLHAGEMTPEEMLVTTVRLSLGLELDNLDIQEWGFVHALGTNPCKNDSYELIYEEEGTNIASRCMTVKQDTMYVYVALKRKRDPNKAEVYPLCFRRSGDFWSYRQLENGYKMFINPEGKIFLCMAARADESINKVLKEGFGQ